MRVMCVHMRRLWDGWVPPLAIWLRATRMVLQEQSQEVLFAAGHRGGVVLEVLALCSGYGQTEWERWEQERACRQVRWEQRRGKPLPYLPRIYLVHAAGWGFVLCDYLVTRVTRLSRADAEQYGATIQLMVEATTWETVEQDCSLQW